ncbi:MAG: ABC transporter substrate-binding protein [Christensenellales bacterium]|jgi:branched-chain amino acid transport system substrate-binding protein
MKKYGVFVTVLALLIVLSLSFTGCAPKAKEYVIGFAGPLTGTSAQDGQAALKGLQIAVDQINKAGGIDGATVIIDSQDDKSDPTEAATIANKFAQDKKILAVVGNYNSSCTLAASPIFNQVGLSQIAFGSSSPAVTDAGPFTYRTIPTDDIGGRYAAKWAFEKYGVQKAAIVYENTDYGVGVAEIYKEECEAAGIEIVAYESYLVGESTDFTTIVTKIKSGDPDVIFIGGLYNETALIAKQAARMDAEYPIVGVDGIYSPALIELGGADVEGVTFSAFFSDVNPDPVVQEFVKLYQEANGEAPSTYAAYAYDAGLCVLEALKNAGADRTKINDYLTTLSGLNGATGVTTFDENGDVNRVPSMVAVVGGAFEVID